MENSWILSVFMLFFLAIFHIGENSNNTGYLTDLEVQEKLIKKLLVNSEVRKLIVPINDGEPVRLKIAISIRQIAQVDEMKQAILVNAWMRQYWNNPNLRWSLEEYPNIKNVHISKNHIWIPDTCLYNKHIAKEQTDILYRRLSTNIIVDHQGNCTWLAPAELFAQCNIDVTKYPFDEHVCPLIFGSWTYDHNNIDVDYVKKTADLEDLIVDSEWDLIDTEFKRKFSVYSSNKSFANLRLEIRIKRLPKYYVINTIIPCILIAVLSIITFLLPTDHGERVALVITVLLAMSVYMLMVSSNLPQSSLSIPDICIFFLCIIVEIAVCLLATVVTIRISAKDSELPVWVDYIMNKFLGRLLGIRVGKCQEKYVVNSVYYNSSCELSKFKGSGTNGTHEIEASRNGNLNEEAGELAINTEKLKSELLVITNHVREENARESRNQEWKKVGKIFDRFFFFFFVIVFAVTCIVFFK